MRNKRTQKSAVDVSARFCQPMLLGWLDIVKTSDGIQFVGGICFPWQESKNIFEPRPIKWCNMVCSVIQICTSAKHIVKTFTYLQYLFTLCSCFVVWVTLLRDNPVRNTMGIRTYWRRVSSIWMPSLCLLKEGTRRSMDVFHPFTRLGEIHSVPASGLRAWTKGRFKSQDEVS